MYNYYILVTVSCMFVVLKVTLIMQLDLAMAWLLKRVLWRSALVASGGGCVPASGTIKMHLLSVDNWDIQQQVTL